jgi:hypothetical protein
MMPYTHNIMPQRSPVNQNLSGAMIVDCGALERRLQDVHVTLLSESYMHARQRSISMQTSPQHHKHLRANTALPSMLISSLSGYRSNSDKEMHVVAMCVQ